MDDFDGKVAVITGAASGIGLALAHHAAGLGMKLALADIEAAALNDAAAGLRDGGAELLIQAVDVRDAAAMAAFANAVFDRYGTVHLLCNNAGVGGGGPLWEATVEDWEWVLGVNLWGVIHGLRLFVPAIVANNEGHVVNTASVAGLMSAPNTGTYTVSKHAVVAMSEVLTGDIRNAGADQVGVSVLCPSFVATRIYASDRNRPENTVTSAEQQAIEEMAAGFFASAMPADDAARLVFDAITARRFYVLTHPAGTREKVERRMRQILDDGYPDLGGPEDFPLT